MGLPRRLGQPLVLVAAASLLSLVHLQVTVSLQSKRSPGADWPMYNRDLGGTRFSPLKQITPKNVANLKLAWQFRLRPDTIGSAGIGSRSVLSGDADRRRRRHVSAGRQSHPGPRSGLRKDLGPTT